MGWEPITLSEINDLISKSLLELPDVIVQDWKKIAINPVKWTEETHGQDGNGFWVVAKNNNSVIWYNDIEEGFNLSVIDEEGIISEYSCEQLELHHILFRLFG